MKQLMLLSFLTCLFSTSLMAQGDISKMAGFYKCNKTIINDGNVTKKEVENCTVTVESYNGGQYLSAKLDRAPKFPTESTDVLGLLLDHNQNVKKFEFGCIDKIASLKNIGDNKYGIECYGSRGSGNENKVMYKAFITLVNENRIVYEGFWRTGSVRNFLSKQLRQ